MPEMQFAVTAVVHGMNVTVPFDNEYVPTFATLTVVDTQSGALVPGEHNLVDEEVNVAPTGAESLTKRSTLWEAPTMPMVESEVAADAPGGLTDGVMSAEPTWPRESCTT
jgi:hypothetical protein